MGRAHLSGPFDLEDAEIDRVVEARRPGVFVLGGSGTFSLRDARVGRSDTNINNQLHVYVDSYRYFSFKYCSSPRDAFEVECDLFHDINPHDNPIHPVRPEGATWTCPRCDLLG